MSINRSSFPTGISLAIHLLNEKISLVKNTPIVIAIDGHSSSGKSTLAKDLSSLFGYKHLDSGAMYRAVTFYALQNGLDISSEEMIEENLENIDIDFQLREGQLVTLLNNVDVEKEIRSLEVSNHVSLISTYSCVRAFLVKRQKEMGKTKGVIMDGRDIGSVVFPKAEIKFFITADLEVRVKRRYQEMLAKDPETPSTALDVQQNLSQRDELDSSRSDSPLVMADDAIFLDTSEMDRKEQLIEALKLMFSKLDGSPSN